MLASLKHITSQVKVAYTFFDPIYYNQKQELIVDAYYAETSLYPSFGQIKQYTISETTTDFNDNVVYDNPFTSDDHFSTYSVERSDFAI